MNKKKLFSQFFLDMLGNEYRISTTLALQVVSLSLLLSFFLVTDAWTSRKRTGRKMKKMKKRKRASKLVARGAGALEREREEKRREEREKGERGSSCPHGL